MDSVLCNVLQERLRRGIEGVHINSLHEHLDQQMLKQVLGEVLHRAGPSRNGPAPDLQILSSVVLSRWVAAVPLLISKPSWV